MIVSLNFKEHSSSSDPLSHIEVPTPNTNTMMKLALLAALVGTSAAFAPANLPVTVTSLNAKSQSLPFLEAPPNCEGYVGNVGFDPFRFSDFAPVDFLREAELKHGRIAMMAWLGYVSVDCGLRVLPVPEALEGVTAATAHDASVLQGGLSQMFLWFSLLEVVDGIAINQMLEGSGRAPGDFGFDGGMLKGKSKEYIEDMKLKEITHCRLAMLAFSGVVTQSVLTQGPFPYV